MKIESLVFHYFARSSQLRMTLVTVLSIFLGITNNLATQPLSENSTTADRVEIPFEFVNGFIVLDVVFQNIFPLKFIYDSGTSYSVLLKREYIDYLGITRQKKIQLLGSDRSKLISADIYNFIRLQITNMPSSYHHMIALEDDFLALDEYIGYKIDGILGSEFFKNMVVHIDYKKSILTIINPAQFNPEKYSKYTEFDLELSSWKPYITCKTWILPDKPDHLKLLIDTGAALTAIFNQDSTSFVKNDHRFIKGQLGSGIGGNIEGYTGKLHRLEIGPFSFENIVSSFQPINDTMYNSMTTKSHGLIGSDILKRFDIIIDYQHSKLYLKPRRKYNRPFKYDKSGITTFAYGSKLNKFYIKYIIDNSPADKAGLKEGDIIISINGWSYKWYSLARINRKFSSKEGKKIKLKVKRGEKVIKTKFILTDFFSDTHPTSFP